MEYGISAPVETFYDDVDLLSLIWLIKGLTHWGRVTHICVSKLTIIGADNGLSPGRRQAIIWTNVGILLIGPLGTNVNEISIQIHAFSFKKFHLKMSSGKCRPFCLGLNVLSVDRIYIWDMLTVYVQRFIFSKDEYICISILYHSSTLQNHSQMK